MNWSRIKLELFYIHKSFLEYRKGFKYLKNKYFLAPKILKRRRVLEKPINFKDLSIHILSSHKDLIMLIWSLGSFYQHMRIIGQVYLHSDGTITNKDEKIIKDFFPSIKIIKPEQFLKFYQSNLKSYPVIKKFRTKYPQFFLLKKIIDPYFISDKNCHLIIDSDLGWFKEPIELEEEIKNRCQNSLMLLNNRPCYVTFWNGTKISQEKANYNSGIVLYRKDNFNLKKLSNYLSNIDIYNPLNKHFIEQAGYAVCLENLQFLPPKYYTIAQPLDNRIILKHYTSPRRPLFYIEALEKIKEVVLR